MSVHQISNEVFVKALDELGDDPALEVALSALSDHELVRKYFSCACCGCDTLEQFNDTELDDLFSGCNTLSDARCIVLAGVPGVAYVAPVTPEVPALSVEERVLVQHAARSFLSTLSAVIAEGRVDGDSLTWEQYSAVLDGVLTHIVSQLHTSCQTFINNTRE